MDIKLHYTESGKGFPLVLLHGNGESGEYFHFQKEYFCRYFRVIVPDTRGHGGSPRGNIDFFQSRDCNLDICIKFSWFVFSLPRYNLYIICFFKRDFF